MLKAHEYAEVFPMMADDDLAELASDIKANGLQDKIVTLNGLILDGRNRYAACQIAGYDVGPADVKEYRGDDPLGYVVSCNLHRRHLTTSQRGIVAGKLETLKLGKNQHNLEGSGIPLPSAAEKLRVSVDTVKEAKKVLANGTPEQIKDVESGKKSIHKVVKEIEEKDAEPEPDDGAEFVATVETLCRDMDQVAARIKELKSSPFAYSIGTDPAVAQVEAARKTLWQGRPAHVCPYCDGKGCKPCSKTGRVKRSTYDAGKEARK